MFVSGGASAVYAFVTPPELPAGFESAQAVSSLYAAVSSYSAWIGKAFSPVLGFFFVTDATEAETAAAPAATMSVAASVKFDFDGDGKADLARWQPSTGEWKYKKSSNNAVITHSNAGNSNSAIAPGDFDGDGITDRAVFNAGWWTISPSVGSDYTVGNGLAGDQPVVGDYNADGRSDYAVYRPSNHTWSILYSNSNFSGEFVFGIAGDIPAPGDYDGDGRTDAAMFRPSTGTWYIRYTVSGAISIFQWGQNGDTPVPGDYNNDGKTDLAVYRPGAGTWYVYYSNGGGSYLQFNWGNYGDQPVPADYDGDGKTDIAIWRPKTASWFVVRSSDGSFLIEQFGTTGDTPIEAAYIRKIGSIAADYDFAKLRLSPKNSTGGTDLYSRNFAWGTGLVGLPGRAGLDAGLGISYNSLVWTKNGNSMVFDSDYSNVSPGFMMDFPKIEPVYYDSTVPNGRFSYLMVAPSGARIEFQQIGASKFYETVDSSYAQLEVVTGNDPNIISQTTLKVTGTDGTQMRYVWIAGAYRCDQIKDRNGNFITIVYDAYGLLRSFTDTLGRVVTINYDGEYYPVSITQTWYGSNGTNSVANETRTYATFQYIAKYVTSEFQSSLGIFGPKNANIKVLDRIIYGTAASNTGETRFEYNNFGAGADGQKLFGGGRTA